MHVLPRRHMLRCKLCRCACDFPGTKAQQFAAACLVEVGALQLHEEILIEEGQREAVLGGRAACVAALEQLIARQPPPVCRLQPLLKPAYWTCES